MSFSTHPAFPAATLLEKQARFTWDHLGDADRLDISQSETTLTDLILLDIRRAGLSELRVLEKATATREAQAGFDWLWYVGAPGWGYWPYAVQAKRLTPYKKKGIGSYKSLDHHVKKSTKKKNNHPGGYQVALLRSFAAQEGWIPTYALYNGTAHLKAGTQSIQPQHWHCTLPQDSPQLGCSVTPAWVVDAEVNPPGGTRRPSRPFGALHAHPLTLPWRCLARCPGLILPPVNPLADPNADPIARQGLPEFLLEAMDGTGTHFTPPPVGDGQLRLPFPNRVLVSTVDPGEVERDFDNRRPRPPLEPDFPHDLS